MEVKYQVPCEGCSAKRVNCFENCDRHYWDGINGCNNCENGVRRRENDLRTYGNRGYLFECCINEHKREYVGATFICEKWRPKNGDQVSKAIYDTAEKRSESDGDTPTAE